MELRPTPWSNKLGLIYFQTRRLGEELVGRHCGTREGCSTRSWKRARIDLRAVQAASQGGWGLPPHEFHRSTSRRKRRHQRLP